MLPEYTVSLFGAVLVAGVAGLPLSRDCDTMTEVWREKLAKVCRVFVFFAFVPQL